ncbi:hypothetical protein E2C01_063825 [Portunus trituberculatus]|uniref:Uncharacterized protein n=1 Tax=Portunus trituberculatus TaxID=210409 RepID=A0A5B7HM36_PORTR|nr:hypothetical protein [Portunus trituberculatus]
MASPAHHHGLVKWFNIRSLDGLDETALCWSGCLTTNKQKESQRETSPGTGRSRTTTWREKKTKKNRKMRTKKTTTRRRMRKWTSWEAEVKEKYLRSSPVSQINPPTPKQEYDPPASKITTAG